MNRCSRLGVLCLAVVAAGGGVACSGGGSPSARIDGGLSDIALTASSEEIQLLWEDAKAAFRRGEFGTATELELDRRPTLRVVGIGQSKETAGTRVVPRQRDVQATGWAQG